MFSKNNCMGGKAYGIEKKEQKATESINEKTREEGNTVKNFGDLDALSS